MEGIVTSIRQIQTLLDEQYEVQDVFRKLNLTDPKIVQETESTTAEIKRNLSLSPVSEMKSLLVDKLKLLETCTV